MYITATEEQNVIALNEEQKFGNRNIQGMQYKDVISLDKKHLFVKLDELNPTINGKWDNRFDYQYSSVSEAVVSCLTRHIQDENFYSVDYKFRTFTHLDTVMTGTISEIFLKENEVEQILSTGHTNNPNTSIDINTYATEIADKPVHESYKALLHAFVDNGVPEDDAKDFLMKQAAFDIIVGNEDRMTNPSNFVSSYNIKTKTSRPINLDYGRALQIPIWTRTTEQNYQFDEWFDEDIQGFTDSVLQKNTSLLYGLNNKESLEFLKTNGFQPFSINLDAVHKDLDDLYDLFDRGPVAKFGKVKIELMKSILEHPLVKELYIDTSNILTYDDLTDLDTQQQVS